MLLLFFKEISWTWTVPYTKRKYEFTLLAEGLNWFDAAGACAARGGRLVQPDSNLKSDNIKEKLSSLDEDVFLSSNREVWIGASYYPNGDPNFAPQWPLKYTDGSVLWFQDFHAFRKGKFQNIRSVICYILIVYISVKTETFRVCNFVKILYCLQ